MIKNENGFTLVEMIAVVIILGILMLFAVPGISKLLQKFRIDYYSKLEDDITESTKEYYNDNRIYRPDGILKSDHIDINNALVGNDYINSVLDYRKNTCPGSYSIIIYRGNGEYIYQTCLKCSNDEYNTKSKYCDSAWLNNNNISYETGSDNGLSIVKRNDKGEELDRIDIENAE